MCSVALIESGGGNAYSVEKIYANHKFVELIQTHPGGLIGVGRAVVDVSIKVRFSIFNLCSFYFA